jgi:PKD repeat protein
MRKSALFTIALLLFTIAAFGQSHWQWKKRGGGTTAGTGGTDETVTDMTTDRNGNLYVLSQLYSSGDIDGHPVAGWGGKDILLTSFKCDGTFRWSKILGGTAADIPVSVKADTLDGVFVCGQMATHLTTVHIDADTSWNMGSYYKNIFLAKFDTSGTYKWFRMPQADTITSASLSKTYLLDMDVDGGGNIFLIAALPSGQYGGTYSDTGASAVHMLRYDSNGSFLGGRRMDIGYSTIDIAAIHLRRNAAQRKFYVTGLNGATGGTSGLILGGHSIVSSLYIGCFDDTCAYIWSKANVVNTAHPTPRAAFDSLNNIYLTGVMTTTDNFGSFSTTGSGYAMPVAMKLDTNGNVVWGKSATVNTISMGSAITVNGNEVIVAGSYQGTLTWSGSSLSLSHAGGCGAGVFITRFDAAGGGIIAVDSIVNDCGHDAFPTAIAAHKKPNFFVGGNFANTVNVYGGVLTSSGGGSDLFVANYGLPNCGCPLVAASFTSSGTKHINFSYNGSAGYDSVSWTFGDGGISSAVNPVHVYTAAGTYTVCVTTYNSCGANSYCHTVTAASGLYEVPLVFANVNIYPNPVNERLVIDNIDPGTRVELYDIVGKKVYAGIAVSVLYTIDTKGYPAGTYFLKLQNEFGAVMSKIVVKE